jgi:hypothetical protein
MRSRKLARRGGPGQFRCFDPIVHPYLVELGGATGIGDNAMIPETPLFRSVSNRLVIFACGTDGTSAARSMLQVPGRPMSVNGG